MLASLVEIQSNCWRSILSSTSAAGRSPPPPPTSALPPPPPTPRSFEATSPMNLLNPLAADTWDNRRRAWTYLLCQFCYDVRVKPARRRGHAGGAQRGMLGTRKCQGLRMCTSPQPRRSGRVHVTGGEGYKTELDEGQAAARPASDGAAQINVCCDFSSFSWNKSLNKASGYELQSTWCRSQNH